MSDPIENRLPNITTLPNDGRPYIIVTIQEDGSMKVSGSIEDKILAYGLLASAKDEIRKFHDKREKEGRVRNSGGLIQMLRRGKP